MNIKDLKKLQSLFIDAEDWNEVSRIQFKMDTLLPEPKKIPKISPWFLTMFKINLLKQLKAEASKIIYIGKLHEKHNKTEIVK